MMIVRRVGHGHDAGLHDIGVGDEGALDLVRRYVVVAEAHHVDHPIQERYLAVVVEVSQVARVQPAYTERRKSLY